MGKGKRDGRRAGSVRGRIGRGRKGVRGRVGIGLLKGNRRGLKKIQKGSKGFESTVKTDRKKVARRSTKVDARRLKKESAARRKVPARPIRNPSRKSSRSRRKENAERDAEPVVNRGQTDRERTSKKGLKAALRPLENDANDAPAKGSTGERNGSGKAVEKKMKKI